MNCRLRLRTARRPGGSARQHHHDVGSDFVCIKNNVDRRRVVAEGVVEIRAQGPEAGLAGTSSMTHQLQAAVGWNQAAVQELNNQLTSTVAGGSNDGDAQGCSLGLRSSSLFSRRMMQSTSESTSDSAGPNRVSGGFGSTS